MATTLIRKDILEDRQKRLLPAMKVWRNYGACKSPDERTPEQRAWDSAILAASEYLRRVTDYDEALAFAIHDLLTPVEPQQ